MSHGNTLGEYLAIAVSLEHLGETTGNKRALQLSKALNNAIERLLQNRKSPGRKVNQLDNRASNFYIALYWSEFMAEVDPEYQNLATQLKDHRKEVSICLVLDLVLSLSLILSFSYPCPFFDLSLSLFLTRNLI